MCPLRNVLLFGLVSFFTDLSSEMVYPLVPLFLTQRLGATPAVVGLIEGVAESVASLLKVVSGHWSDRLGRRQPLAFAGYAASAAGKVLLPLAGAWPVVLLARFADRVGKGIRGAPRDALIAEAIPAGQRGRAFGLHRAMDTLGAVAGVTLAYLFMTGEQRDYAPLFGWALLPAALGALLVLLARETDSRRPARPAAALRLEWGRLPRQLRLYLAVMVLFTLGNSSNQFLLLRAADLGASPGRVLLLYLLFNAVYALAAYPAGWLSDRLGRRLLLVLGYGLYGLVYLGFGAATSLPAVWGLFAAYGLYQGVTEGVEKALLADLAPADRKATVLGLHATLVGITLLPASLLAGLLWNGFGAAAPFYLGGALGLAAAGALWRVLGRTAARLPPV